MKLAQYHKDAIARSIINDLPKHDDADTQRLLQDALYKAMSPECKRLYNKKPDALREHYFYDVFEGNGRTLTVGDADYKKTAEPFVVAKKARSDLRSKVRAAVDACSTRKQFIDRYPEFSKYAPSEHGACPTLPAVANLVSELVQAGWEQTISKG